MSHDLVPREPDPHSLLDLSQEEVRLEVLSPLEEGLEMSLFLGFLPVLVGGLGMMVSLGGSAVLWGLPLVVLFGALRAGTDCHYLLDNPGRQLRYRRRMLGTESSETLATFDEVHIVTVRGQSQEIEEGERVWSYAVVFLLQDGTSIQVSPFRPDLAPQNRLAATLARHVGANLIPGRERQILEQVPECKLPEVIRSENRRGAAAEHLLGDGLFTASFGYLLCLPAFWWTGPVALSSILGLWAGTETLTAATGYLLLLMVSLFPCAPVLMTGVQMVLRAIGETRTKSECEALESQGFERGFDIFANLLLVDLVIWVTAYLSSVAFPGSVLVSGKLAALALAGGNLALLLGGCSGLLPLGSATAPQALSEPVLLRLVSRLERQSSHCGYCGTAVPGEEAVACNRCEAIHHRECWAEFGKCTTFGCGSEACSEVSPRE